jgi:hypothetical protein
MRFTSVIELGGKTATGICVPEEIVAALGAGKRPPVRVTINGYTYRNTIAPMGGRFMLSVSAAVRESASVAAGDEVEVEIEHDTSPRDVTVPADFAAALSPAARERFDALSYSNKLRHVLAIEGAKTPATRERRIAKVIAELTA